MGAPALRAGGGPKNATDSHSETLCIELVLGFGAKGEPLDLLSFGVYVE
jgi:hypothetical protein